MTESPIYGCSHTAISLLELWTSEIAALMHIVSVMAHTRAAHIIRTAMVITIEKVYLVFRLSGKSRSGVTSPLFSWPEVDIKEQFKSLKFDFCLRFTSFVSTPTLCIHYAPHCWLFTGTLKNTFIWIFTTIVCILVIYRNANDLSQCWTVFVSICWCRYFLKNLIICFV